MSAASQPSLFSAIDRFCGMAVPASTPTLHLDEDEQVATARDQVDLYPIGPDVARDDAITLGLEEPGGAHFALMSEPLAVIRHASTHRCDKVGMGTLHIVATPIGNLEDVTLRALRVLREVDWVLAEDTRRTRILLDHFEIPQKPTSLHAHNEAGRIESVLDALEEGRSVALVSDAGTPLVSDPGARLVAAAAQAGHTVEAVPGPSALLTALTVSGLDTERVLFLGFLPRKSGARRRLLETQKGRPETIVLFESPRRVAATLREIADILGNRAGCLARELTKRHEEVSRESVLVLAERFAESPPRGECTLVIAGATADEEQAEVAWSDDELDRAIRAELAGGSSIRDLARDLAGRTGRPRREVYTRAVSLREEPRATDAGAPISMKPGDAGAPE